MKRLSKEQCERFISVRDELLEKVSIFEAGVLYFEKHVEHKECSDKLWIYKIRDAINALDLEKSEFEGQSIQFEQCSDFAFGMLVATYFSKMEEIMLAELNETIEPFDKLLPEYRKQVIEILKP